MNKQRSTRAARKPSVTRTTQTKTISDPVAAVMRPFPALVTRWNRKPSDYASNPAIEADMKLASAEMDARVALACHVQPTTLEGIAGQIAIASGYADWTGVVDAEGLCFSLPWLKESCAAMHAALMNALTGLASLGVAPPEWSHYYLTDDDRQRLAVIARRMGATSGKGGAA